MSRYRWSKAELLSHAEHLQASADRIDPKLAADTAERFAKRIETSDPVVANWVRQSFTRDRWLKVIDQIRSHVALGDLASATLAAQSFENERNHIARLIAAPELRAGARAVAGAAKGRTVRQDSNEHRNELIRAYFAEHAVTPAGAKRFKLSTRQVRRIVAQK
jgi:hypothetical protein